jgi:CheY-like chemotaxis protein
LSRKIKSLEIKAYRMTEPQKRVLVIDDEPGIREIVAMALRAIAHWHPILAESGAEGLTKAVAEQPDAILLDVMMPDMDGLTTFQHLQDDPITQAIPVILLTAKVQIVEQQQFMKIGVTGMITKPFKAPALIAQIRQILDWYGS